MGNSCTKGTKGGDPAETIELNESTRHHQSTLESDYTGRHKESSLSSNMTFDSPNTSPSNLLDSTADTIKIEDFKILKVIGRGSFGKVYMVKKKSDGAIYAMKTLKKDFVIRTKQVANTKVERDIMQQINHPFIVKLHFAF